MKNYVVDESIYRFMGVGGESRELFSFLIDSDESLKQFFEEFYNGNALESIMKYKNYKKGIHSVDILEFEKRINRGEVVEVFREIFQEPLSEDDIDMIDRFGLTYTDIYNKQRKYPFERFMNLVKGNYIDNKNWDDSFLIE